MYNTLKLDDSIWPRIKKVKAEQSCLDK